MCERPNIRGAALWCLGIWLAACIWGYLSARLNIPFVPFCIFAIAIASAAMFPPDRFKLWRKGEE